MTDTATATATFGPMTTTRDESEAKAPRRDTSRDAGARRETRAAREIVFELSDVSVRYSGVTAVQDVDLDISANEITAFIGPSGCGKTTVLRSLNRMHDLTPDARSHRDGHATTARTSTAPKVDAAEVRRRIGMVFQKPNPFPKSVYDNVAYGPRINGVKRASSTTSSSRR